jgi:hypothetical protein
MWTLKFQGNYDKQHPGPNITVRLGPTWAKRLAFNQREVRLADAESDRSQVVPVIMAWKGPLGRIPAETLQMEHDPELRDYDKLAEALSGWYGKKVTRTSVVSVIGYQIGEENDESTD